MLAAAVARTLDSCLHCTGIENAIPMISDLPSISEETARRMIQAGEAGYWEMSLRDSISKSPIPHAVQTCVCVGDTWYLVPREYFSITSHGRTQLGDVNAKADSITCSHPGLIAAVQAQIAARQRPGFVSGLN